MTCPRFKLLSSFQTGKPGHIDAAFLLLKRGFNSNREENDECDACSTALHNAVGAQNVAMVRLLIRCSAKNEANDLAMKILYTATCYRTIIPWILSSNISVTEQHMVLRMTISKRGWLDRGIWGRRCLARAVEKVGKDRSTRAGLQESTRGWNQEVDIGTGETDIFFFTSKYKARGSSSCTRLAINTETIRSCGHLCKMVADMVLKSDDDDEDHHGDDDKKEAEKDTKTLRRFESLQSLP